MADDRAAVLRTRRRRPGLAVAAAIPLVLAVLSPTARAAEAVQRVEVRLAVDGGEPHPVVVQRMLDAIGSAAERLLVGRDSDLVGRQEAVLAGVLRDVTDRVVTGYRVAALGFRTGPTTVVQVRVQPQPPVLGALPVDLRLPGVHPDAQALVRDAARSAAAEAGGLTARLPVDALPWAGPVLERQMTESVERTVPGFTAAGRIEAGAAPRIVLALAPRDARVIRDIGVRFRSSSIPYTLLQGHAPQVASMAEPLRGLPVAFAAAQREALERLLAGRLAAYPPAQAYHVVARPALQVAEVAYVTVLADSTLYRGRLEARINFGTRAPAPDVRAELGRAFGSVEPFVQFTLVPSTLSFRTGIGVRVDVGTHVAVGAVTSFDQTGLEPFAAYRLSPDLQIRGRYETGTGILETAVTYRVTEFLSWEGVASSGGIVWLRVISNL